MSVIAELSIPTDRFALEQTLEEAPAVEVGFERCVTHSQHWIMPFVWVSGDDRSAFERSVGDDPTVEEAAVIDRLDAADLYMIRWSDRVREMVNDVFDRAGILREASGTSAGWSLEVQFVDYASLNDLEEHFDAGDSAYTLERLYTADASCGVTAGLTSEQQETLVAAAEAGYFEIPRGATLDELASELGISSTAASERIRRGLVTLVSATLPVDDSAGNTG